VENCLRIAEMWDSRLVLQWPIYQKSYGKSTLRLHVLVRPRQVCTFPQVSCNINQRGECAWVTSVVSVCRTSWGWDMLSLRTQGALFTGWTWWVQEHLGLLRETVWGLEAPEWLILQIQHHVFLWKSCNRSFRFLVLL
jgi:hypothetical protein